MDAGSFFSRVSRLCFSPSISWLSAILWIAEMNEIGFAAVDANPSAEYLGLYEVFVPRDPRAQDGGSSLPANI